MTITAATRKGSGRTNQDRYITGPTFAAVLDGASNFTEELPEHDGGWYAGTLGARLRELLTAQPDSPLPKIVERAIESVVAEHDLRPDTSPTSTIALSRWDDQYVEIYVLGDSTATIIQTGGGEESITDDRLARIAPELRTSYRQRLASGNGYDDELRRLLTALQDEQAKHRNRDAGFWIAGADPQAGHHAILRAHLRERVGCVILATDGAASGINRFHSFASWRDLRVMSLAEALFVIEKEEAQDADGQRWPRSKPHDDKTLVRVGLARSPA